MTGSAAGAMRVIGKARPRIDGPLKVTGTAKYTSDHSFPGMLYAVPVGATIASGTIQTIDTARARQMPGVRAVFKSGDLGKMSAITPDFTSVYMDEVRPPLDDDVVRYYGQYVALVVADTFEQAKAAADAVAVTYKTDKANVDHHLKADTTNVASERGDADAGFAQAPVTIDVDVRDRHGDAQSDRDPCNDRRPRRRYADPLRDIARHREPSQRGRGHARPAARQGARDQQVPRVGVWQQAVCLAAVPARGSGSARAQEARQAGPQPADDVLQRRPPSPHRAAPAHRRKARRQARVAAARLRECHVDPGRLRGELR